MPFDKKDIEENKVIAAVGYLFVLCFIPLLGAKDSAFAQSHGRQGLALAVFGICVIIYDTMFGWVPFIGWLSGAVLTLAWCVFSIIGIVKALTGEKWEVPIIGKYFLNINL